jgi:hypothetical protein
MSAASRQPIYGQSPEATTPDWAAVAADAWEAPGWREAAVEYHKSCAARRAIVEIAPERLTQLRRVMAEDVSVEQAQRKLAEHRRDGTATVTVEALMLGLREGIESLQSNCDRLRRLSELSAEQVRFVCERLQRFKPDIAPAWSSEEVRALIRIWGRINAPVS